jgi:hypothetical protein
MTERKLPPKDYARKVAERLFERNPDLDLETFQDAMLRGAKHDPKLLDAMLRDFAEAAMDRLARGELGEWEWLKAPAGVQWLKSRKEGTNG